MLASVLHYLQDLNLTSSDWEQHIPVGYFFHPNSSNNIVVLAIKCYYSNLSHKADLYFVCIWFHELLSLAQILFNKYPVVSVRPIHASHLCWFKCLFKVSLIKLLPVMLHPSKSSVSFEVIPDLHPHISDFSMQEVGFGLRKTFQTGLIPSNRPVCNSRCG